MASLFEIKVYISCNFLENDKMNLRQIFFHGLGQEKTLVHCKIEKHCIRPLS